MRYALALLSLLALSGTSQAQTLRFNTSVGSFDMVLNPTDNANLQPLVNNMVANVTAGVYHRGVVHRAVDDFVVQLGSFLTDSVNVEELPVGGFEGVNSFDPVVVDADGNGQVDFSTAGLTNTRGTVSLALSAAGPNSGSSSFFVNLGDNSFLDAQGFVPFATIPDMTTVDRIESLETLDLTQTLGLPPDVATYTDVPLSERGEFVVMESVAVIDDSGLPFTGPLQTAFGVDVPIGATEDMIAEDIADDMAGGVDPTLTPEEIEAMFPPIAAASATSNGGAAGAAVGVPEPGAGLLLLLGTALRRRR
ncbi:MAG: peptidylprolyl isomerase [Planctomycetota bacterium]